MSWSLLGNIPYYIVKFFKPNKTKVMNLNLDFIQARLKSTDSVKIADRTGYSRSHVINTLSGRRNNDTILKEAYRVVGRRKAVMA